MKCPICQSDKTKVLRTKSSTELSMVDRKRQCNNCGEIFWSVEVSQPPKHFTVMKRNGKPDTFSWEKIYYSIKETCRNLNVTYEEQRDIFINSMRELSIYSNRKDRIQSVEIGEVILKYLEPVNKVAWLRYLTHFIDTEQNLRSRLESWVSEGLIPRIE